MQRRLQGVNWDDGILRSLLANKDELEAQTAAYRQSVAGANGGYGGYLREVPRPDPVLEAGLEAKQAGTPLPKRSFVPGEGHAPESLYDTYRRRSGGR